jgi:diphthine-ammonia ligase
MKTAVVLWTGGKDSCLALHLASEENFKILALVTFVPEGNTEFQAHPQSKMLRQAERLGLKIHFVEIREPYRPSYVEALKWIKNSMGAATVVTGDIDLVQGQPNWIVDCCGGLGLEVHRPLWKKDRAWIMQELLSRKIQVRISYINHPAIPSTWLNRLIDEGLLKELQSLASSSGIDLAGENGEYHTMVVDGPLLRTGV